LHHSPCWFHCCCELESLSYAPLYLKLIESLKN
jgi:hypothetical protein